MSNTILIKKSGTANAAPGTLAYGELAINYNDGNLFYKNSSNVITVIASNKFLSVTGNIDGGNINTGGIISAASTVTAGNVLTGGIVSATGNVYGNYFIGNGSQLSGVTATAVDANNLLGNTLSSNVIYSSLTTVGVLTSLSVSGNVAAGNVLTDNIYYANGTPWDMQNPAGSNTWIQYNENGDFGASGNLAFDSATNIFSTANITASGSLSATGNITGGNIINQNLTSGRVTFAGADKQLTDSSDLAWDNGTSTLTVSGTSSTTGNVIGGNINTAGLITAGGNVTGGNILTGGLMSATGNITGGNISTSGSGGNISGANVISGTTLSATANVVGGNIVTVGLVSAAGNVIGDYFLGNISYANGYSASKIYNGTSNVDVAAANSNVTVAVNGTANVAVFANTGAYITGELSTSGNVTSSNVNTAGLISAGGDITGANLLTGGMVSASGDVSGNNLYGSGELSVTGNVTGGNVNTAGLISAGGDITGANLTTTGLTSTGDLAITGTITGDLIPAVNFGGNIGNNTNAWKDLWLSGTTIYLGSQSLTSNASGVSVTNAVYAPTVSASGNIIGGNINTVGLITSSGNITGGNLVTGGLISASGNATVANVNTAGLVTAGGNVTGGNLLTGGVASATGTITGGNLVTGGLVTAAGDVTGANIFTGGVVSAAGTVTGGNLATGGTASAAGNVTGGNILTSGLVSAGSNVTGANLLTGGLVSAAANITGGNVLTNGLISAQGNVTAGNVNTNAVVGTGLTVTSTGNLNLQPTGNIVLANAYINGLANPQQDQDAATKYYVDQAVTTGFAFHPAVYAATVGTLEAATGGTITYAQPNGAGNGIGATLTTTGTFDLIDTANVQTIGTRILVKNQANAALNGIYTWGSATVITRSTDADQYGPDSSEALSINDYFFVQAGNVNLGSAYIVDAPAGTITFGTSNISFAQFSSTQVYTANTSAGLSLIGQTFNAKVDNNTTAFDGGGNIIVKASANLTTPNIGAATGTSVTLTGTANVGNVITGGIVSATGNISGGNLSGTNITGTLLTNAQPNITSTGVLNDLTVANTILADGIQSRTGTDFYVSANGTNKNVVLAPTGSGNVTTLANISASGAVIGSGIQTSGVVSATGNVIGGNILFDGGVVSGTGNVYGGNVIASEAFIGNVSLTGNVTLVNVFASGVVSAAGNVTGGNINSGGLASITGNVVGGNLLTVGLISASGNITGGNILTLGTANLATGVITTLLNVTATTAATNTTSGAVTVAGGVGVVGNIYAGGMYVGGDSVLTVNSTVDGGTF
jgi:filamentous hemagglutinin